MHLFVYLSQVVYWDSFIRSPFVDGLHGTAPSPSNPSIPTSPLANHATSRIVHSLHKLSTNTTQRINE